MTTRRRARSNQASRTATRDLVVETALRLFAERGYEGTTMRLIATEAGVALGNAYHYFPSKDHLAQEFFVRIRREHDRLAAPVLRATAAFEDRLRGVLHAGIDVMVPYRDFGASFISSAIRPDSVTGHFTTDVNQSRDRGISLFEEVVHGSSPPVDGPLAADLPLLLWTLHLGVILVWLHDDSPESTRSHETADRAARLVVDLVRFSTLPESAGLAAAALDLLHSIAPARAPAPGQATTGGAPQ